MKRTAVAAGSALATVLVSICGFATSANENAGPGYTRFDNVNATGTAISPTGAVSNVINVATDDVNAEGSGSPAYYSALTVQDLAFGGPQARGGRIVVQSALNQKRPSSVNGLLHDYVAVQGHVTTEKGDGGTPSAPRGQYYSFWGAASIGKEAEYVDALLGLEVDLGAIAGSSLNNKSGVMVNHTGPNNDLDAVQGKTNDNMFWAWGGKRQVGSKVGFQFGREDIAADYGVAGDGALIATVGHSSVAHGVDLRTARCTVACWESPGVTIDGLGTIAGIAYREKLATPASSSAPCVPGQYGDDADFHYVCVARNKWKRVALSDF